MIPKTNCQDLLRELGFRRGTDRKREGDETLLGTGDWLRAQSGDGKERDARRQDWHGGSGGVSRNTDRAPSRFAGVRVMMRDHANGGRNHQQKA